MASDGAYLLIEGADEVERALNRLGLKFSDLDFRVIADDGMRLAARFAPHRTGRLQASIKASTSVSKAVIRAGGARVPYAGVINYGWARHGIGPVHFMQRADAVLRRTVPIELRRQTDRLIRRQGMS